VFLGEASYDSSSDDEAQQQIDRESECSEELQEEGGDWEGDAWEEKPSNVSCVMTKEYVNVLNPTALRAELKALGLLTRGNKQMLRQRLLDAISTTMAPDFQDVVKELGKL